MIQFLLNDHKINIESERADLTLLNFLRDERKLCGSKEGCASGDCGACTIVIAEPVAKHPAGDSSNAQEMTASNKQALSYRAINSCVTFLSALHGKQVITVEHLQKDKVLHPVQAAMVNANASQCGFCTPGFVMSIFALYQQSEPVDRAAAITALSGNLCRCTGYKPIIDATLAVCAEQKPSQNTPENQRVAEQLIAIQNANSGELLHSNNLFLPKTRQQLAAYMEQFPQAMLIAGSTDIALLHTQELKPLNKLISLSYMNDLQAVELNDKVLKVGAACTLSDIQTVLLKHFPSLHEIIERFASVPIRNQATLGGNLAGASPIGDMAPVLIALNANIELDDGLNTRTLALKEFFTGYRKTQLAEHEWVRSVHIPLLSANQRLVAYKISKRFEDDISAVCVALNLTVENGKVLKLSTGFGGVAATPAFCEKLETSMIGKNWQNKECVEIGQHILASAFTPLSDVRASSEYRNKMLVNLWHRFWLESNAQENSIATRVI